MMEILKFLNSNKFFPKYAPDVKNWRHKNRGVDGNNKSIRFFPEDEISIVSGFLRLLVDLQLETKTFVNCFESENIYAIKITDQHVPKNKLQTLIQLEVRKLNQVYFSQKEEAISALYKAVEIAHQLCPTKCKPHKWYEYEHGQLHHAFSISGVIYVSVYTLSKK